MDFKQHFKRSWQTMANFFLPILFITLIFCVVPTFYLGSYMQSLLLAQRDGQKPHAKDLLSRLDLLPFLVGVFFLFGLAELAAMAAIKTAGPKVMGLPSATYCVAAVLMLPKNFFLFHALPLMIDQRTLALKTVVRESVSMVLEAPIGEHAATVATLFVLDFAQNFFVLNAGLNFIAIYAGIGNLLTFPFCSLLLLSFYEQKRSRRLAAATELASPPAAGS